MPRTKVVQLGGAGLFNHYHSLEKMLRAIYPDYPWDSSRFLGADRIPRGHWKDKNNLANALAQAELKLGITRVTFPPFLTSSSSLTTSRAHA